MNIKDIFPHRKIWPAVGLIVIFGIVVAFALNLKRGYDDKLANAATDSQNLAFAVEHHAAATLQKTDLVLNRLVDEFSPGYGDKWLNPQRISNYLLTLRLKQPELQSLRIVKADGHVLYTLYTLAEGGGIVSPLSLGDEAYFTGHRDNPNLGLTLSEAAQEPGGLDRNFILSRRLNNPDGSFAGIAAATISLAYFEGFYASLNPGKNASLTLLNDKAAMLARFPAVRGKTLAGSQLEAHLRKTPHGATYSGASSVDGVERVFSFRQVGDLPLYVEAGLAKSDILADWRRNALIDGTALAVLVAVMVFFSYGRSRRSGGVAEAEAEAEKQLPSFYPRNLIEANLDPLLTISPDGFITAANQAAERITGVARTQLVGSDFCAYFTEPDKAREGYRKAFADGFVRDYPLVMCNANGRVTEVLYNITEYWSEAGDVQGVYAIASDVTERRRSERLLKLENHALEIVCGHASLSAILDLLCRGMEEILDESLCAIMLLDKDGLHLRHGAAPSLPDDYNQAIDGVAIGPAAASWATAAFTGRQVISTDIAHDPLWADYKKLALSHDLAACCATPIYSEKEDLLGIFAVYYRATYQPTPFDLQAGSRAAHLAGVAIRRKRSDEMLANLNETLQQRATQANAKAEGSRAEHLASIALLRKRADESLNQLKNVMEQRVAEEVGKIMEQERKFMQRSRLAATSEIIGNIAHQWRQPLNALDLLLANIKDAQKFHELDPQMLVQSTIEGRQIIHEMFGTIDDFRNFFKPDKEKVAFSVKQGIQGTLDILSASLRDYHIQAQIEAGDDIIAYGYPNDYSQVLLNILNNAKDALVANNAINGVIHIRVVRVGEQACVIVRDNAGGIPADMLAKIFEPYFTTKHKGTGIGLYMSKMIIEDSMDGKIEARNVEGGAEFVLTCPAAK